MKKYLPYILAVLSFGVLLSLSIILNSCNKPNNRLIAKHICIIDSFYEKKPVAINDIQKTYVYHTTCGSNIFTYNKNMYHISDTLIY